MKKRILSAFCIIALICLFSANAFAAALGMPADDFTLSLSNGESFSLGKQLQDKCGVAIVFCDESEACIKTLSALDAAVETLKDKIIPLVILAGEDKSVSEPIWNNLIPATESREIAEAFGAIQLPHTVIIDRFGTVCFSRSGEIDSAEKWISLLSTFADDNYPASILLEDIPATMADYVIAFIDESGSPVSGAMAQVCDDKRCMVFPSGANGKVEFTEATYPYEIHVLMAPEGFAPDTQVYTLPESSGEITIVLKAK